VRSGKEHHDHRRCHKRSHQDAQCHRRRNVSTLDVINVGHDSLPCGQPSCAALGPAIAICAGVAKTYFLEREPLALLFGFVGAGLTVRPLILSVTERLVASDLFAMFDFIGLANDGS